MFCFSSSRSRNGKRSSSGRDAIEPSGRITDATRGWRGSSGMTTTSQMLGPGSSSDVFNASGNCSGLETLRAEIKAETAILRGEMGTIRGEMAELRAHIDAGFDRLENALKLHELEHHK